MFIFNLGSDSSEGNIQHFDYTELRQQSVNLKNSIDSSNYKGYVCLTFDDGPDPYFTPAIVKELNRRNQRATFFLVGKYIQNLPTVNQLMIDGKHEVGNHTWSHIKLSHSGLGRAQDQLLKTSQSIKTYFGDEPNWYRPPYGLTNQSVNNLALNHGMRVLMWDVDTSDYLSPSPSTLLSRVSSRTFNGAVVLMHSNKANTNKSLPSILNWFERNKYLLVTASEWHQIKFHNKSIKDILLARMGVETIQLPPSHFNADLVDEITVEPSTNPNETVNQPVEEAVNSGTTGADEG